MLDNLSMAVSHGKRMRTTFAIETRTLPHLFARTAAQVTQFFYPDPILVKTRREIITIEAATPSLLLRHWLNQIIWLFREKQFLFSTFDVRQLGPKEKGWILQAEVTGERIESLSTSSSSPLTCSSAKLFGDDQTCRAEFTLTRRD